MTNAFRSAVGWGSLHYLQARQDFMTREERRLLEQSGTTFTTLSTKEIPLNMNNTL